MCYGIVTKKSLHTSKWKLISIKKRVKEFINNKWLLLDIVSSSHLFQIVNIFVLICLKLASARPATGSVRGTFNNAAQASCIAKPSQKYMRKQEVKTICFFVGFLVDDGENRKDCMTTVGIKLAIPTAITQTLHAACPVWTHSE